MSGDKMERLNKIDAAGLGATVMALAGHNSYRDIAAILTEKHNLSISYQAVGDYIKGHAEGNREKVRAKLDERLDNDLDTDLERLDTLYNFFISMTENEDVSNRDRISAADKARAVLETKYKFGGNNASIEIHNGSVKFIHVNEQRRTDAEASTNAHSTGVDSE